MPLGDLDDPSRIDEVRTLIQRKAALRHYYLEVYEKYAACLRRCPSEGIALELGSGAGFIKSEIPDVMTSDVLPYAGIDRVVDATRMPFEDQSLRAILMMNVFHHIPDAEAFLREASRCLKPGARIYMLDQHVNWFSRFVYRHAHHEPFDPDAKEWRFESTGPLSGANGALATIVFERDRDRFERLHPELRLEVFRPHTPLRYWLAGGLKRWSLLPGWGFSAATFLEQKLSPGFGCFVDIEIVKAERADAPRPGSVKEAAWGGSSSLF
jgi:SAM-dependent methyltransferase